MKTNSLKISFCAFAHSKIYLAVIQLHIAESGEEARIESSEKKKCRRSKSVDDARLRRNLLNRILSCNFSASLHHKFTVWRDSRDAIWGKEMGGKAKTRLKPSYINYEKSYFHDDLTLSTLHLFRFPQSRSSNSNLHIYRAHAASFDPQQRERSSSSNSDQSASSAAATCFSSHHMWYLNRIKSTHKNY